MDGIRVLLVEDDQLLSTFLKYKLVRSGFDVTSANNGEDALAEMERTHFDVVLLDIMLPRMNGFHLMQRISEIPQFSPGVWIVLSSRSSDEDLLRAFELGAADFITKPFSMEVLLARINAALRFKSGAGQSNIVQEPREDDSEEADAPQKPETKIKGWHSTNL